MRINVLRIALITIMVLAATDGRTEPEGRLVQRKSSVRIDWTAGVATAESRGKTDAQVTSNASAPGLAEAAAGARENLIQGLRGIRIDTSRRLSRLTAADAAVLERINAMVTHLPVIEQLQRRQADGSIEVQLVMSLRGEFAQLALPAEIRKIDSITRVLPPSNGTSPELPATADENAFSGLVLDARGILAEPALAPKVLDERLDEVYGPTFASREHAVQRGVVSYYTDLDAALADPRLGSRPLVVKAMRTAWPGMCDLVISNVDADKIRRSSEHLVFLRECRVVILLDPI